MITTANNITLNDLFSGNSKEEKNLLQDKGMFISSAGAWGALFKDLITALGFERAKRFLLRYGYQCGKHEAIMLRDMFEWKNKKEWIAAGITMNNLSGRSSSRPTINKINIETGEYYAHGYWYNSYEANQFLQHFPVHSEPVCSFLQGYASGYCSTALGTKVLYKELECIGKGDKHCRYIGKSIGLWGKNIPLDLMDDTQEDIGNELDQAYIRIEKQGEVLKRINSLHSQLTQIVLEGKGLNEIAKTLGESQKCSVIIFDQHYEPIARNRKSQEFSLKSIIKKIEQLSDANKKNIYEMLHEKKTITLNPIKSLHYPFYSIIAPIVARNNIYGFISIINDDHELNGHEKGFIERAANICALHILNEKTAVETEYKMKEELLNDIIFQPNLNEITVKKLSYLGYNFNEPHYVFIFRFQNHKNNELLKVDKDHIITILRKDSTYAKQDILMSNQSSQVYALIPDSFIKSLKSTPQQYGEQVLQSLQQRDADFSVVIGISNACTGVGNFNKGFKQAEKALEVSRINEQKERVILFSDLGYVSILLDARNPEELKAYANRILSAIFEYDIHKSSELLKTLYFYLNNECNLHKTARYMNLSIGGMRYRLSSIKERFNIDMTKSNTRREVQLALDIYLAFGQLSKVW